MILFTKDDVFKATEGTPFYPEREETPVIAFITDEGRLVTRGEMEVLGEEEFESSLQNQLERYDDTTS